MKIQQLLEFGIINIDKPSGPTSFSVSEFVCKKLGLKKTSHFGTLDPKVTGVLPIALNRACKLTGFFLGEDKEYVGIMRIHEDIEMKKIQEIINKKFLGVISQKPPVKSRVKREFREREIKTFELIEKKEKDILFKTEVQGGTYIRKLIDDLGKEIGGAHMLELQRIRAGLFTESGRFFKSKKFREGIFNENKSITLYEFEKAVDEFNAGNEKPLREMLIPGEKAIAELYPKIEVKESTIKQLFTGKPIYYGDLIKENLNDKIKKDSVNKKEISRGIKAEKEEKSLRGQINKTASKGGSEPLGEYLGENYRANQKIEKGSNIAVFNKNKFIGVYKVTNEENIFARPEFVLQPIKN